jgi:hypothetical protein
MSNFFKKNVIYFFRNNYFSKKIRGIGIPLRKGIVIPNGIIIPRNRPLLNKGMIITSIPVVYSANHEKKNIIFKCF